MSRSPHPRLAPALGGLELVPPTLLIAVGHPLLGVATLAGVLVWWVLQLRMITRAEQRRDETILSYAHTSATMGADPSSVVAAMRARPEPATDGDAERAAPRSGNDAWRDGPRLHIP